MASHPSPPPTDSMGRSRLVAVSSSLIVNGDLDMFPDSAYSSPGSAQLSPASPAEQTRESLKDGHEGSSAGFSDLDPASGPQRTRSATNSNSTAGPSEHKEKRKRSRVTPEQLAHLERLFATDRSPTAARRKEISEMLGMQERQTQIWFQNRRAKAKLQESRREHGDGEHPQDFVPSLVAGSDAELYYLVHEDEPISVIPCIELSIGTWKRVISGPGKFDLVAYACETTKRLTWYIRSTGQGFKMEVPFSTIVDTKFANTTTPGMGQASFILTQPPIFYLEHIVAAPDPIMGTAAVRTWKRCSDWTEDMQATSVLQHDIVGAAVQLAHVLRNIAAYTAGPSISLYPAYHPAPGPPHVSPAADPSSCAPMAGIAEQSCDASNASQISHFGYEEYGLRRRFSTPALIQPHSIRHFPTNVFPPPSTGYASSAAVATAGSGSNGGVDAGMSPSSTYSDLSSTMSTATSPIIRHHAHFSSASVADDFPRLPISQTISSRRSFAGPSSSYVDVRHGTARPYSSGGLPSHAAMVAAARSPYLLRRASSTTWEPTSHNESGFMTFAENGVPAGMEQLPASALDTPSGYPSTPDYQSQ